MEQHIRVYAEYFNEKDIGYRKTTIIQIGDSWELLGSAILKIREVQNQSIRKLKIKI